MRFPIGLKIFGIAVGLLILMAAAALLNMRMTRTVDSQLTIIDQNYFPAYVALAQANIRSVEESAYVRRRLLAIAEPAAASTAFGSPAGRYQNHPASPRYTAAESTIRARCAARIHSVGRQRSRSLTPCRARQDARHASKRRRSSGARQDPCDVGGAWPTYDLFRRKRVPVRFTEIHLFGVYVASMSSMMVIAWVATIGLR